MWGREDEDENKNKNKNKNKNNESDDDYEDMDKDKDEDVDDDVERGCDRSTSHSTLCNVAFRSNPVMTINLGN